jgi:hypothetical protein
MIDGAGSRIEWSTEMTDLLLALYEKQQKATGAERGVNGTSWPIIVAGMKAQYPSTVFTAEKLRNKFCGDQERLHRV